MLIQQMTSDQLVGWNINSIREAATQRKQSTKHKCYSIQAVQRGPDSSLGLTTDNREERKTEREREKLRLL